MTLLQAIDRFVDDISVTDRQEESIKTSYSNIKSHLEDEDLNLSVAEVFLNGSYERDTIIKPLNDIDIFAVLKHDAYVDEMGQLPKPQNVLSKLKNALESVPEYKDKVSQDRPCVTVTLSDKVFDVLPAFRFFDGMFYIPTEDLTGWQIIPDPDTHTKDLNRVNVDHSYKVKKIIKVVKHWNRSMGKPFIPFQIEQLAIKIFGASDFNNLEEGVRLWFANTSVYIHQLVFKTINAKQEAESKTGKVKEDLNTAKAFLDKKEDGLARKIWRKVFGDQFKIGDVEQANQFSELLQTGNLKYSNTAGLSSSNGMTVLPLSGFYGDGYYDKV
jgi:hypothetical protein